MGDQLLLGIFYALLAMFSHGIGHALAIVPAEKMNIQRFIFYRELVASLFVFVVLVFFVNTYSFDWAYFLLALLLSMVGFVGQIFFVKAYKFGNIGTVVPIINSSVVVTVILAITVLSEPVEPQRLFMVIVTIIGILLVSFQGGGNGKSGIWGLVYALTAMLLWGTMYAYFKITVEFFGPYIALLINETGITIYSACTIFVNPKIKFSPVPRGELLVYVILTGVLIALGMMLYNLGISVAEIHIIAPIAFSRTMVTMVYAKMVYKRVIRLNQWLGAILTTLGIAGIYILS